jgi:hypothetical protein
MNTLPMIECQKISPLLSVTMFTSLIFGYIQLGMFALFALGLLAWGSSKIFGCPKVEFTPGSLCAQQ